MLFLQNGDSTVIIGVEYVAIPMHNIASIDFYLCMDCVGGLPIVFNLVMYSLG
jgi:hypothetical protein